jgi:DNA-binding ferritin-like protein (Dps family)
MSLIDKLVGDLSEKKRFRANEKRAKSLPPEYRDAYKKIRNYLWSTSGVESFDPLVSLVDLLEEAAADGRSVTDITGPDVAAFADDLVKGESSYQDKQREKLNKKFTDDRYKYKFGISGPLIRGSS